MKEWILKRYASSTFNQCTHTALPEMSGPPMEIHLKANAIPRKITNPSAVPEHWRDLVKEQLDSDTRLGVIEKVTEPSAWCHRMVVVGKPDGTPRQTVDFQPLNKWCHREEWITDPPAKIARRVTRGAWKTVTDA